MIDPEFLRAVGRVAAETGVRHLQVKTPDGAVLILEFEPRPPAMDGPLVEPPGEPGGWKRGATTIGDEDR
jgi:hypothetical protein